MLSHKTETRPRRSIFPNSQDQDKTRRSTFKTEMFQKRIETAVSQFRNTSWWSLSLDNLFLAGQIHYYLRDISASLIHCMDVHKTTVTRPRPRRYIFKTETRPRRSTLKTETRPRRRRSTFKTETRRSKKRLETASRPRRSRPRLHLWLIGIVDFEKVWIFCVCILGWFHWQCVLL